MCDIAPFSMECEFDDVKHKLVCCKANHLSCAFRQLQQSLPLVGGWFEDYKCQAFEPKGWRADNGHS